MTTKKIQWIARVAFVILILGILHQIGVLFPRNASVAPGSLVVVDRVYHRPTWRNTLTIDGKVGLARTEPEYVAVCIDSNGVEWSVQVTGKEFYTIHIGDTLAR
jgi:hypothetical protein